MVKIFCSIASKADETITAEEDSSKRVWKPTLKIRKEKKTKSTDSTITDPMNFLLI